MIRLKLVKGETDNVADSVPHGTSVLMDLMVPWINSWRIVCSDIYFALVTAADLLWKNRFKFIRALGTAMIHFPMAHLAAQELDNRGDRYRLVTRK